MGFDYIKQTKNHYQDASVAAAYHAEFNSLGGLNGFRFKLVASRERALVRKYLQVLEAGAVLDIPSGTGKMAPVYKSLEIAVVSADISSQMLDIAREVYRDIGYQRVDFVQCDAESSWELVRSRTFDAVVCMRLMHRVPSNVRRNMLKGFSRVAKHLIVSYGIDSPYHRFRRSLRRRLIGGLDISVSEYATMRLASDEILECFEILDCRPVIRGISNEYVFLAASR